MLRFCTLMAFVVSAVLHCFAVSNAAAQQRHIELLVGYSELLQLEETLGNVIVGNPEIADATVISEIGIVLTGREIGQTNLIVADEAGNELFSAVLQVSPLDRRPQFRVRVMKGGAREDATLYLCGPPPGCIAVDEADQNEVPLTAVAEETPAATTGGEPSADEVPAIVDPE